MLPYWLFSTPEVKPSSQTCLHFSGLWKGLSIAPDSTRAPPHTCTRMYIYVVRFCSLSSHQHCILPSVYLFLLTGILSSLLDTLPIWLNVRIPKRVPSFYVVPVKTFSKKLTATSMMQWMLPAMSSLILTCSQVEVPQKWLYLTLSQRKPNQCLEFTSGHIKLLQRRWRLSLKLSSRTVVAVQLGHWQLSGYVDV